MRHGPFKRFRRSPRRKAEGAAVSENAISRGWDRLLLNTWFPEIVALVFSAACVIGIAVVLIVYDGKPQPEDMLYGLTLNAIVSVLATAAKSALICAIAGAIGQVKWIWFRKFRRLRDIQSFDDASRGPWGSLTLFFTFNIRTLASIGTLITFLALAFDPFVQQIIKYPLHSMPSRHSSAVIKTNSFFETSMLDDTYYRAAQSGLWTKDNIFEHPATCPSSHCEWPPYRSVELCSRCIDAMPYAVLSPCDLDSFWSGEVDHLICNLSFGHGTNVEVFHGHADEEDFRQHEIAANLTENVIWRISAVSGHGLGMNPLNSTFSPQYQRGFDDIPVPGSVFGHAVLKQSLGYYTPNKFVLEHAEECVLTHCAKDYKLSVSEGHQNKSLLGTHYGLYKIEDFPLDPYVGYVGGEPAQHLCWQSKPGTVTYTMGDYGRVNETYNAFCPAVASLDTISDAITGAQKMPCDRAYGSDMHCWGPLTGVEMQFLWAKDGLENTLNRVTASVNTLNQLSGESVEGQVTVARAHVHVRWPWFILPLTLEALGILFVAAVMIHSRLKKIRLWKSSVLPLLFHG